MRHGQSGARASKLYRFRSSVQAATAGQVRGTGSWIIESCGAQRANMEAGVDEVSLVTSNHPSPTIVHGQSAIRTRSAFLVHGPSSIVHGQHFQSHRRAREFTQPVVTQSPCSYSHAPLRLPPRAPRGQPSAVSPEKSAIRDLRSPIQIRPSFLVGRKHTQD
jgi:hypothetical protein